MKATPRKPPSPVRTSFRNVQKSYGSSPLSANEEERIKQLTRIFEQIDTNHDKKLSFEEIQAFLTSQQDEEFDMILCSELFARMDKDHDSMVTIDEFIANYVEVESLIVKQIKTVMKEIKTLEKSIKENQEKLKKARETEILRSNGIMEGSCLTVNVKSALNLFPTTADGTCNAFVMVECDGTNTTTRVVPNSLSPTWDEVFEIPIINKGATLNLTVFSKSGLGTKFVGKTSASLAQLADQTQIEQYYNLLSEQGETWQGKVLLELTWIWSMVKYYSDIISQQEKFIKEDQEKIESLKSQMSKLLKPFASLTPGFDYIYEPSISGAIDNTIIVPIRAPVAKNSFIEWSESAEVMISLIYIYIILAVLNNFKRPDFLNVILIQTTASVVGYYHWRFQDVQGMKMFLSAVLISEIFDLVWVFCWGKSWLMIETEAVLLCLFLIGFKGLFSLIIAKRYGFLKLE
jgi:hypothetical protein